MKHAAVALYWVVATIHLVACLGVDLDLIRAYRLFVLTKPLLMPLLMVVLHLGARPAPADIPLRHIHLALIASCAGDVLLIFPGTVFFLAGMGAFGVAHIFYVRAWSRVFSLRTPLEFDRAIFVLPLFVYVYVCYSIIHPNLAPWLRPIIIVYMGLLVANCFTAFIRRLVVDSPSATATFIGAFVFMQSDSLIALNEFRATYADGTRAPGLPFVQLMIMATYVIGQWLIVRGVIARANETPAAAAVAAGGATTAPAGPRPA